MARRGVIAMPLYGGKRGREYGLCGKRSNGSPAFAETIFTRKASENWLGRKDSNLRMPESKSGALPLGYAPVRLGARTITAGTMPGNPAGAS